MNRLALLCLLAFVCSPLWAATLKVPGDHATIAAAVAAAATGDTIAISKNPASADGSYTENVTVPNTKRLNFVGKVIWDGTPGGTEGDCLTLQGPNLGTTPILISGITFRNCDIGVNADDGLNAVDTVTVTGCKGLNVNGTLADLRGANCTVTKNVLVFCQGVCDIIGNGAIVTGNKHSIGDDGVSITGNNALVEKNTFAQLEESDNISVTGNTAIIRSNSFKSLDGGISVTGNDAVITGNKFANCNDGIDLNGTDALISGNSLTNCSEGINSANGSTNTEILKNKLKTIFNDGIDVDGNNITIQGNSITDIVDDGDGIELTGAGSSGLIDANKIKGCMADDAGINCEAGGVTISNNSVSLGGGEDEPGIRVTSDSCTLTKNKVSLFDGDGFNITGNSCTVTDCSSTKNGEDGFDNDGTNTTNTFTNCVASGNQGEGFDNSTSTGTVVTGGSFTKNRIDIAGNTTNGATITISTETKFVTGSAAQVPQID